MCLDHHLVPPLTLLKNLIELIKLNTYNGFMQMQYNCYVYLLEVAANLKK